MSIMEQEWSEGVVDFSAMAVWTCVEHDQRVRVGADCPFCVYDSVGPVEFEKWAQRLH